MSPLSDNTPFHIKSNGSSKDTDGRSRHVIPATKLSYAQGENLPLFSTKRVAGLNGRKCPQKCKKHESLVLTPHVRH